MLSERWREPFSVVWGGVLPIIGLGVFLPNYITYTGTGTR